MDTFLWIKLLHTLSATILFGTGLGTAYFKWIGDRHGNVRSIRVMNERVVLADWLFTLPAGIVQPVTGVMLAGLAGYSLRTGWLVVSMALYVVVGIAWLVIVRLQIRMRDMARLADRSDTLLPAQYWRCARTWFWLGFPAFCMLLVVFWLMVVKPV